jgi:hypothetical protein
MTDNTDPRAPAAYLGHVPTDPTWPADTSRTPVPMTLFGTDHWSTFAYVETRTVDHNGLLNHDQMRCHANRHPAMLAAKTPVSPPGGDGSRYPTRTKASPTVGADGTYGVTEVPEHDDYDCLDDLIAAGLLEAKMPAADPSGGVFVGQRPVGLSGGDSQRPPRLRLKARLYFLPADELIDRQAGREGSGPRPAAGRLGPHLSPGRAQRTPGVAGLSD